MKQRIVAYSVVLLLVLSVFSFIPVRISTAKAQGNASLVGVISDKGVDRNSNGLFEYLNVTIGINVTAPGYFTLESTFLIDDLIPSNSISCSAETSGYLYTGTGQNLTLSFYGPTINHAHLNPYSLGNLMLYTNGTLVDFLYEPDRTLQLSRVYNYSEFDPRAVLTGTISAKGVDTDGDGLFNYLQVGVEINVTDAEAYTVYVQLFSSYTVGAIYNSSTVNLSPGRQIVNLSFNGAMIRFSKMNFSSVEEIYLQEANNENNGIAFKPLDSLSYAPLGVTYFYTEFQTLAYFTGKIDDKGFSNPGDSKFDYLAIDVQINVTEAGNYSISIYNLYGPMTNGSSVNYSDYKSEYFSVGLQFVNFACPSQMIYASKVNPSSIESIQLLAYMGGSWWFVDQLSNVPLQKVYNYTEFNPHAYLTGRVYDHGVDTDHDGLFDYLQTSIEVNVTVDGTYQVILQGLAENSSSQLYDYQTSNNLDLHKGIHLFNFTFYGPEIAYSGINPRNVTGISLNEISNSSAFSGQLDYVQSIPLSTQYNCSEFDHPLNSMVLNFTVNPDGSVGINAMLNETHMYPENAYGPVINASARLSKMNNSLLGSVNGTVGLPPSTTVPWTYPYYQAQFPTNQTTADYLSQYNNGILTEKLDATSVFPTIVKTRYPYNTTDFTFSGKYSNGLLHAQLNGSSTIPQDIASETPFNVTDVTIEANLGNNNEFKGNITLHAISGLPTGDIIVNFQGNRSNLLFTGNVTILYGTYEGTVINATKVDQLISEIKVNTTGEGPSSLYNMTDGILECTNIKITNTTISNGVEIDYNASIHGDFAALIAKYVNNLYFSYLYGGQYYQSTYAALNATLSSVNNMSFIMAYTHAQSLAQMGISFDSNVETLWSNALKLIPPTLPSNMSQSETDEITALLKSENATAYAVQNAWLNFTYLGTDPQPTLNLSTGLVENAAQLNNETIKLMPDLLAYEYPTSPQVQNIIEAYLNNTYATLNSWNTTIHLRNGIADFRTDFTFEGNLDEQLNAAKSCYFNIMNYDLSLFNETLPTQMSLINQTSIDVNHLSVNLQYGRNNAFLNATGIVVYPPKQVIDNYQFKLSNFFNVTSEYNEPPTRYQKLRISIQGGSNSTYTIIPSRPATVPPPSNVTSDGKTFTWENTTVSSLRDMTFNIAYQGKYQSGSTIYYVPILSNSTISNFKFDLNSKTISFNVTGPSGTTGFCNITIPRRLLDIKAQNNWTIMEDGNLISSAQCNVTSNADYCFIYITYSHSSHVISITGDISTIQEMPPNTIPLVMLPISLIAVLLVVTQRRRIRNLKTKSLEIADRISHNCFLYLKGIDSKLMFFMVRKNVASINVIDQHRT